MYTSEVTFSNLVEGKYGMEIKMIQRKHEKRQKTKRQGEKVGNITGTNTSEIK